MSRGPRPRRRPRPMMKPTRSSDPFLVLARRGRHAFSFGLADDQRSRRALLNQSRAPAPQRAPSCTGRPARLPQAAPPAAESTKSTAVDAKRRRPPIDGQSLSPSSTCRRPTLAGGGWGRQNAAVGCDHIDLGRSKTCSRRGRPHPHHSRRSERHIGSHAAPPPHPARPAADRRHAVTHRRTARRIRAAAVGRGRQIRANRGPARGRARTRQTTSSEQSEATNPLD